MSENTPALTPGKVKQGLQEALTLARRGGYDLAEQAILCALVPAPPVENAEKVAAARLRELGFPRRPRWDRGYAIGYLAGFVAGAHWARNTPDQVLSEPDTSVPFDRTRIAGGTKAVQRAPYPMDHDPTTNGENR